MRISSTLFLVVIVSGMAACAHHAPTTEDATIAGAHSFAIHIGLVGQAGYRMTHLTPTTLMLASEAAGDILVSRGYVPTMAGRSDLIVEIEGGVRATGNNAETVLESVDGAVALNQSNNAPYNYIEGTIDIGVFDARTKRLLWRRRSVELLHDPGRVDPARVRRAVEQLLASLPPHTS